MGHFGRIQLKNGRALRYTEVPDPDSMISPTTLMTIVPAKAKTALKRIITVTVWTTAELAYIISFREKVLTCLDANVI
jgi:hypothetical protein